MRAQVSEGTVAPDLAGARCPVHPGRPAVDRCPVCIRPRCGTDAAQSVGGGCAACRGQRSAESAGPAAARSPAPPSDLERLVRASLAATAAGTAGGVVASEYVGAPYFSFLAPFVVGVLCGAAATRAARTDGRGALGLRVRAVSVLYALLGVAVGFRLVPGGPSAFTPFGEVVVPYLAALAGAALWTQPPRNRPRARRRS